MNKVDAVETDGYKHTSVPKKRQGFLIKMPPGASSATAVSGVSERSAVTET
jgi:hypothetical protein